MTTIGYATRRAINWTEQGLVPDGVVRSAIRRLLRARLVELRADDVEHVADETARFVAEMDQSPIAPLPHKANEQHYELPADFFVEVLGPQRKYSACCWNDGVESLAAAERKCCPKAPWWCSAATVPSRARVRGGFCGRTLPIW